MVRLTKDQILEIYKAEGLYKDVAKKFKVSASCVTHIKTGLRHSSVTGASNTNNERKREPAVNKVQAQAIYDYLTEEGEVRTQEDASIYFGLPKYTIRRVMGQYIKKFKIRRYA